MAGFRSKSGSITTSASESEGIVSLTGNGITNTMVNLTPLTLTPVQAKANIYI